MEFTLEAIEESIRVMNEQPAAVEFLNVWSNMPDSIIDAAHLLRDSQNPNVKSVCLIHIYRNVSRFWNQISDLHTKVSCKNILVTIILSYTQNDNNIKQLAKALAQIAIFEFPEEWPTFSCFFFSDSNGENLLSDLNSLKITRYFFKEIETSRNIVPPRKRLLIDICLIPSDKLIEHLTKFIETPEFANDVLSIYHYLILWSKLDSFFSNTIFDRILNIYLLHEETCHKSVKCLVSVFLYRFDSSTIFQTYSPMVLTALSAGRFPNQQPITSNVKVFDFVLRFFVTYLHIFEVVFASDQIAGNPEFSYMFDENVIGLNETLSANKISSSELHQHILNLIQIILSIPIERVTPVYWQLWSDALQRVHFEFIIQQPNGPSRLFYMPFFQNIIQGIFNLLESASDEKGAYLYPAQKTIELLFQIDSAAFLQFLTSQAPSINLCIAIGMLETHFKINPSAQSLSQVFEEMLNVVPTSQDPQFVAMLLTSLGHSGYLLSSNQDLLYKYITLVLECLTESETCIVDAAVSSLLYADDNEDVFNEETKPLLEQIIDKNELFIYQLSQENSSLMFKNCALLIDKYYQDPTEMFIQLLSPCLPIMTQSLDFFKRIAANPNQEIPLYPAEDGDDKGFPFLEEKTRNALQTALLALIEVGTIVDNSINGLYDIFWPVLYETTVLLVTSPGFSNQAIDLYFSADVIFQSYADREKVNVTEQIGQFIQMMHARGKLEESFFYYFTTLLMYDKKDDFFLISLFPTIFEQFIQPCLQMQTDDNLPLVALFRLLEKFTIDFYPTFLPFIINGILDNRLDISKSALECLKKFVSQFDNTHGPSFLSETTETDVIGALIEIITDDIHRPNMVIALDIFQQIIQITSHMNETIRNYIHKSLASKIEEPIPGLFQKFANYIVSCYHRFYLFRRAFFNLLITLKKVCPGDSQVFNVTPIELRTTFVFSDAMPTQTLQLEQLSS